MPRDGSDRPRRTIAEMLEALKRHIRLLEEFREKVFVEGNSDYAGEIAGKLRLLATQSGTNRPLLVDIMKETGIEPRITLGGPPIHRVSGKPTAGDKVTLSEYLQLDAVGVRVPSGDFVLMNKEQLVRAWAQQTGASHEDWGMDESLSTILNSQI